jgi:4-hydroxy-3-methylbut-2-enyl diphosphate reductase
MGVRRGVNMALEAGSETEGSGKEIYTLGPLIHNSRVLENLNEKGIQALEEDEIHQIPPTSTVIIRAHGVAPHIEDELRNRNIKVLDATCPHVKESQKKARHFTEMGYRIFLAGEKDHGEIIGIKHYAMNLSFGLVNCYIVGNSKEAEAAAAKLFHEDKDAKTVLIGQTTISPGEYQAIETHIKKYFPNLDVIDTICSATANRQEALRELCGQVQAIIIAGAKESANTRRLLSLAKELGKPSWLVEKTEDIPPEIKAYQIVGISAGASTPDELVSEIEEALSGSVN